MKVTDEDVTKVVDAWVFGGEDSFGCVRAALESFAARLSQGAQGEAVGDTDYEAAMARREAWRKKLPSTPGGRVMPPERNGDYQRGYDDDDLRDYALDALDAIYAHHAERAAVPDGWVMVPREPLAKLKEIHDDCEGVSYAYRRREAQLQWDALTAAPQPPEGARVVPEDVEAVTSCLGDDAAFLRMENDGESEIADNMERAAQIIDALRGVP